MTNNNPPRKWGQSRDFKGTRLFLWRKTVTTKQSPEQTFQSARAYLPPEPFPDWMKPMIGIYSLDRFVSHLDALALSTVEKIIGDLVVEERPVILDLMAGWDSHLPEGIQPARLVGLGLNENELQRNKALTEYRLHDLNRGPENPLPGPDL